MTSLSNASYICNLPSSSKALEVDTWEEWLFLRENTSLSMKVNKIRKDNLNLGDKEFRLTGIVRLFGQGSNLLLNRLSGLIK